ncbi:MAG: hypothetical protein NTZ44_02875 [Candidatus Nomurabacteria bacterium]|nr:hypothetical protein [Candidatus Nomurabacteria bacterium]
MDKHNEELTREELFTTMRDESGKLIRSNWALVGVTLLIGIVSMSIMLYVSHVQRSNDLKKESAALMFQLSNEFRNDKNSHLVYTIADNKEPILIQNGGEFTEEQLDNYLVRYELIYNAYKNNLISFDDLNIAFAFDIEMAYNNKEIQKMISIVRTQYKDDSIYGGFTKLGEMLK